MTGKLLNKIKNNKLVDFLYDRLYKNFIYSKILNRDFLKKKVFNKKFIMRLAIYIILGTISYEFIFPILRMLTMTFMSREDLIDPAVSWVPTSISLSNLRVAYHVLNMPQSLWNSIWFSSMLAFFQTIVSALTGYALARFDFKFKKLWYFMLIVTFIIPMPMLGIPRSMIFVTLREMTEMRFIGTIIPQALLTILGQGVHSTILILIFYNFMQMIPKTLDEAAEIDGANRFQIFYHIGIRISIPTVLIVFLMSMIWNWNETFMTTMFLRGGIELLPGNLGLFSSIFSNRAPAGVGGGMSLINEAYTMAATLISILPLIILYFFVQKQFVKGIENTGITGE